MLCPASLSLSINKSHLLVILVGDANRELLLCIWSRSPLLELSLPGHWASLQSISVFRTQNHLSSKYRQTFLVIFSAVSSS